MTQNNILNRLRLPMPEIVDVNFYKLHNPGTVNFNHEYSQRTMSVPKQWPPRGRYPLDPPEQYFYTSFANAKKGRV